MHLLNRLLLKTTLCVLLACNVAYAHLPTAIDNDKLPTLAPMLKKVMPSIVSITGIKYIKPTPQLPITPPNGAESYTPPTSMPSPNYNNQPEEQASVSIGSGVIINAEKGYIATNSHVINDLEEIRVTLSDQRKFEAKLLGQDPASDLALIKIEAGNLTEVQFANSDTLQVGDFVVAIGNPYGFNHTVTSGIISALGRTDIGFDGYYDFIQTDAAINLGNSGGGLVNLNGELVGINTALISSQNNIGNVGIGLAIPSNMAQGILAQLANCGKVDRGPLGVMVQSLTPELAKGFNVDATEGAIITNIIPNTAAHKAGLEIGDVLLRIDNKAIKDATHLRTLISLIPMGKTAKINFSRMGKIHTKLITISDPNEHLTRGIQIFSGLTGVVLEETPQDFPIQGIRIVEIKKSIPLSIIELQENDIIVGANHQQTPNLASLKDAASKRQDILLLQVMRDKFTLFVTIKSTKT